MSGLLEHRQRCGRRRSGTRRLFMTVEVEKPVKEMITAQYLQTMHGWIDLLESKNSTVKQMKLKSKIKTDGKLDKLAFYFANSDEHNELIVRGVDTLVSSAASSLATAQDLLVNVIRRNTYGAFSELAAYDWIIRQHVKITAQVTLTPKDVLGAKGAVIDGKMDYFWDVYFDIKAFGFNGYMAGRLKDLLESKMKGMQVFVNESWDLSYEDLEKYIREVNTIVKELKAKGHTRRGPMNISTSPPKPISVSMISHDPYALAKENAAYPFLSANQFTRNKPFVLIYVVHPWLNHLSLDSDFANADTTFTRAFARRAFMQFSDDKTLARDHCKQISDETTLGDASRLLSAIMFVNVWPSDAYWPGSSESKPKPSWIYLNPRATNKIPHGQMRVFQNNRATYIDDFSNDDY
jgi:hypothetical protein